MNIEFNCNGKKVSIDVPGNMRVIDLLRDELGLTGTKEGCGRGECGACTILVNGNPVNSCIMYAAKLNNTDVITIEGLNKDEQGLHPIQQAYLEEDAVQCGFCTPGMILSTKALLDQNPDPVETEIEEALSGNICRCTGYVKIVNAVKKAVKKIKETEHG